MSYATLYPAVNAWTKSATRRQAVTYALTKVPHITVLFWVTKVISTAMGEALSDFLSGGTGVLPYVSVLATFVVFLGSLWLQFHVPRYKPVHYWFTVAMVAVFGTMAADVVHKVLGAPYWLSSLFYASALAVILWRWWTTERTLAAHSITTRKREAYYWLTVLATFALGTAFGDLTAATFHLGFFLSGIMFAGLIAIPLLLYRFTGLNRVMLFWSAYILTRPLGASFADWLDVPKARGGVGLGTGPVSVVLIICMIVLVAYLHRRHSADADIDAAA